MLRHKEKRHLEDSCCNLFLLILLCELFKCQSNCGPIQLLSLQYFFFFLIKKIIDMDLFEIHNIYSVLEVLEITFLLCVIP